MMSHFAKLARKIFRLMLIMWIALIPLIDVQTQVSAQTSVVPIRVVRSLHTREYGASEPKGLGFSSTANTFFILDGTANLTLVTMGEDNAGVRNLPEVQNDPLNVAFDKKSESLYVFNRGKSELVKIKADGKGLPNGSASPTRFAINAFGIKDAQGIAFDPGSGRLFVLDAGNSQIVSVVPHATLGFDANEAIKSNKVQKISLKKLGLGSLKGLAYDPTNGHLYVSEPAQKKLYKLTLDGTVASTFDLASLGINNPSAMTFAPSGDSTDDPNIYDLFLLDDGGAGQTAKAAFSARAVSPQQTVSADGQIVELSLVAPASLPPGTTLLPASLVHTIDTSSPAWNPSAPDPSGIDYWPPTGKLLISDSEVDEMSIFTGKNVYQSTTSGTLVSTCDTLAFSHEPSGLATNTDNNHVFFSDDDGSNDKVTEVNIGLDGVYCTSDDTHTITNVAGLYGASDAEDVAYGNNTLFIASGIDAEVFRIPLGTDNALGGTGAAADGPMTHFDTATLGFNDLEAIDYNSDAGTLFIASTQGSENYLGETTTSGTLLQAYDLSFMGTTGNLRSDVSQAPGSQNPGINNIYIVSRGIDNNANPNENDGKVWEVNISGSATPTPTNTPTSGPSPTPTNTPTNTPTPTITPTVPVSGNPLYISLAGSGSVGTISYADEDIVSFNGSTWSMFFDGSDVGLNSVDIFAFHYNINTNTILMSFNNSIILGGVPYAPTDIVQFNATSLGATTTGTFSMYFNGADVGLDASSDYIDAIEVLPNNTVLISTRGNPTVPGPTGLADEDLLLFTPTSLGNNTGGTWTLYFDGSDVGLSTNSQEDIDALGVGSNGDIYLSTLGDFSVTGVAGADEDVFVCSPTSLGSTTACTYSPTLYFDGSTWGLSADDVDAFNLMESGSPTATPTNTPTAGPSPTPTNTPTNTPTPTPTNTPTSGPTPTPTNTPTNTPTSTPTNTPSASDLIFADGFESGDLSAWTSNATDIGDLSISVSAALVGSQGMQAVIDDVNTIYVNDDSPNAEPRYRARFYFDPNSITMASGNAHFIFKGFMGTATDVLQVELSPASGPEPYQLRAKILKDDGTFMFTPNWYSLSDAPHFIELDWRASTSAGANNGGLTLWIDGAQQADLTGVDNDTLRIDRARLGALSGIDAGTLGTYYFDAFESRRQTYIGP